MSRLEKIEGDVMELSPRELSAFRKWFAEFDADAWDREFEENAKAGKLDRLAERALRHHKAGMSTKL